MNVVVLQHSTQTPPGSCTDWLDEHGYKWSLVRLFQNEALPTLNCFDWLIVLGGPMNVDDINAYPWLAPEKVLVKQAINAGKICLGICLGSQMIAQVMGGTVQPHDYWEAGWQTVELLEEQRSIPVFQFHQDHLSLPPGAQRIATNAITLNQAFRIGERVIGIQFHPEAKPEWIKERAYGKRHPGVGPHIQSPEMMVEGMENIPAMREWFHKILTGLVNSATKTS